MEIKLDPKADALYIKLRKGKVHKTVEKDEILFDMDKCGGLMGIEVLNYSKSVLEGAKKLPSYNFPKSSV